ncbi:MAG TPA: hypothetical protein VNH63_00025, partial [Gemmatimonadales bacterium]|nr:hypothetical protein [Gemmatimonadales bacterium]
LEADMLKPVPQKDADATFAPKLTRDIARIDWSEPARTVVRKILALDPRPGAWAELEGQEIKLFRAQPAAGTGSPGEVLAADGRLLIAAGGGAVAVQEVQPAGKPRMAAADWVRGRGVAVGRRFT